jgi:1-deoxy-D-xylulose-5-phosphate synthase
MGKILDSIQYPEDLKALSPTSLIKLAEEIRAFMIDIVSTTGGHLAPSLGAVDYIIALHYCLNAPKDKIVFDVGHQSYCHKILTGRKDRFYTLRQKNGISGFPNFNESEYDPFIVGHGSTSISMALGLCAGRDLQNTDEKIVAVIGDGSLGGGMAFEGLNHAGQLKKDVMIILNDNEFSISPSVGAFSRYLNRVITNPVYNRVRSDVERLIRRVPRLGFRLAAAARKLEEGLKNLLVPGIIFEEMGIRYFGPVDGHNIPAMIEVMNNILPLKEPRLIHIITKKGKGFEFAEKAPSKFHGIAPFDTEDGTSYPASGEESFTKGFGDKLIKLAAKDNRITAITAAMPEGTGLDRFEKMFPERFFNVGMAEQHAVGFAAGLAKKGLVPFVAVYSTFLQRSYDQIVHDVALQNLHVIFCLDRAGIVGEDGPTHHGVFDISYLRHIPNLTLMAPKDIPEMELMLEYAAESKGPIAIRYPRGGVLGKTSDSSLQKIESGKAEMLRAGKDIVVIAIGDMAMPALEAARLVAKDNISVEVINLRFIKPMDSDTILRAAKRINKMLIVEDNALLGGAGSAVLEVLSDNNVSINVRRIGIPDNFITHAKRQVLLDDMGLSHEGIADCIRKWHK